MNEDKITFTNEQINQLPGFMQRSLERSPKIMININGNQELIKTGTRLDTLLPESIGDHTVIAALMNNKPVSLSTTVTFPCNISSITTECWEGERIYRHSAALLVLEAAKEIGVLNSLKLGVSLGNVQWIEIICPENVNRKKLEKRLKDKVRDLITANIPFREEWWFIEEASEYFNKNGFKDAASLLHNMREITVPMVSCGKVYALIFGPLISTTGQIKNFELISTETELILSVGGTKQ
jgi:uridine kinase